MRCKHRQRAISLGELMRDRPRQRESIERRRAATDFFDEHKTLRRCAMQDCRGLGHLDHERRAAAGEIVGGADPRVDRVERADPGIRGGDERAAVSKQRDHRGLSHVRRLAAHVGAGDDEQAPVRREVEVVRDERVDLLLDDWVSSAANRDPGRRHEFRVDEIKSFGALSER